MTTQERAEKIVYGLGPKELQGERYATSFEKDLIRRIAAQIDEAEQAVLAACMKIDQKTSEDCYAEGFSAAREKAKEIVQKHGHGLIELEQIADRIAAMKPEDK